MQSTPKQVAGESREQIIDRITSITTMQPGTLTEEFRQGAIGKDGKPSRLGPYYKLQVWRDGANRTSRVPAGCQPIKQAACAKTSTTTTPSANSADRLANSTLNTPSTTTAAYCPTTKTNCPSKTVTATASGASKPYLERSSCGATTTIIPKPATDAARTGDLLGLEGSHTPAVARLMCRAASRAGSYQEAADDLAAYAGLQLDPRDLGRMVAVVAPGLREALAGLKPLADPKAASIPVLYVSCDGTGTPMRREELEGIKGKQPDGSARTREAKLGCVFTQTARDEEGKPLRDPGSTSYTGTYKGCREVAVLLHQEARRRGLDRAKQVVYLGDGAAWVWENCRLTFPRATEILDFYHASEHVGQLAAAIHDNEPAQVAACRSRWCHDMKQTKSRRWTSDPVILPA